MKKSFKKLSINKLNKTTISNLNASMMDKKLGGIKIDPSWLIFLCRTRPTGTRIGCTETNCSICCDF